MQQLKMIRFWLEFELCFVQAILLSSECNNSEFGVKKPYLL